MNASRTQSRFRQQGMVTVLAVLFLITGVIFVLSQTLSITGSNNMVNKQQLDSTQAFFLAESGLERGHYILKNSGMINSAECTAVSGGPYALAAGNFTLSATPTPSTPSLTNPCVNNPNTATACTSCTVTATGIVGTASRKISGDLLTPAINGASTGEASGTPIIKVKNPFNYAVVVFFNLGVVRTEADTSDREFSCFYGSTNAIAAGTTSPCPATSADSWLKWYVKSNEQSNNPSSNAIGVGIPLAANDTVYVRLSFGTNQIFALTGALFKSTNTPIIIGYWRDSDPNPPSTIANNTNTVLVPSTSSSTSYASTYVGRTNSGVATLNSTATTPNPDHGHTCAGASSPPASCRQISTSWCYGGDTLVFGISPIMKNNSTTATDTGPSISAVEFNTATTATPAQNIPLIQLASYPPTIPPTTTSTLDRGIYSQLWYAYNPNLSGGSVASPTAINASSYKGNGTGAIGATWTGGSNTVTGSGTVLNVGTFAGYPNLIISPGDVVSSTGGGFGASNISGVTISSQTGSTESGGALGGRGTYALSGNTTLVSSSSTRTWTTNSNILNVSDCTICFFANPDHLLSGFVTNKTISSQLTPLRTIPLVEATGGRGRYVLSSSGTPALPTRVASATTLRAGTPGATIYLPSAQSMPAVTTPATRIAIFSGTGNLRGNTTVSAVTSPVPNAATNSFTVTPDPSIAVTGFTPAALNTANICAGTCAFFNTPSSTSAVSTSAGTQFRITHPNPIDLINEWGAGFTCLSGMDPNNILPFVSTSVRPSTWTEVVQ